MIYTIRCITPDDSFILTDNDGRDLVFPNRESADFYMNNFGDNHAYDLEDYGLELRKFSDRDMKESEISYMFEFFIDQMG